MSQISLFFFSFINCFSKIISFSHFFPSSLGNGWALKNLIICFYDFRLMLIYRILKRKCFIQYFHPSLNCGIFTFSWLTSENVFSPIIMPGLQEIFFSFVMFPFLLYGILFERHMHEWNMLILPDTSGLNYLWWFNIAKLILLRNLISLSLCNAELFPIADQNCCNPWTKVSLRWSNWIMPNIRNVR